jgi:hypothetical protein
MAPFSEHGFAEILRRFAATGCAALTLLLTVLASSPQLHEHAHAHDETHEVAGDNCAVVIFGSGVSLALSVPEIPRPAITLRLAEARSPENFFAMPARFLHQPERGPPSS